MPSDKLTSPTDPSKIRTLDCIETRAGGILFQEDKEADTKVPSRNPIVRLYNQLNEGITLTAGASLWNTTGVKSLNSTGDFNISSKGTIQIVAEDEIRLYSKKNVVMLHGEQTKDQREAAQKMQNALDKIDKVKGDTLESTKGEEVECPTCAREYLINRKSGFGSRLFKTIRKFTPPYFGYAIDILQNLYNMIIAPMLDIASGKALLGGTCGNKGCKNGKIESSNKKVEAANKAALEEMQNQQKTLDEAGAKLRGGGESKSLTGDYYLETGALMPPSQAKLYRKVGYKTDSYADELETKARAYAVESGKGGSIPSMMFINPTPTIGKFFVKAHATATIIGEQMIDITSRGHGNLIFGSVNLTATEGEALVASDNLTTIKGKGVKIDAKDRSGSGGIILNADHTKVKGALHVNGNVTAKGGFSVDGNLCAPYLVTRSMRLQTAKSGSTKLIGNASNWVGTCQAMEFADKILQTLNKYMQLGNLVDVESIFTLSYETFNTGYQSTILEWPVPTGIFMGVCAGIGGGVCTGYVWNWKHSHNLTPQSHTHDHTVPHGKYLDDRESWGAARTDGSHIPTPATETGDGTTPGPKSSGGSCGGGGGMYGFNSPNSRASRSRRDRNASFGISGDDAYGNYDFVNVSPLSGVFGYDKDGEITPKDKVNLGIGLGCPPDLFTDLVKKYKDSITDC